MRTKIAFNVAPTTALHLIMIGIMVLATTPTTVGFVSRYCPNHQYGQGRVAPSFVKGKQVSKGSVVHIDVPSYILSVSKLSLQENENSNGIKKKRKPVLDETTILRRQIAQAAEGVTEAADGVEKAREIFYRTEKRVERYNREIDKIIVDPDGSKQPQTILKEERDEAKKQLDEARDDLNKAEKQLELREEFYLTLSQASKAPIKISADVWFPTKLLKSENGAEYLEIGRFPPMVHIVRKYKKVFVRKSFEVIFKELMTRAQSCLVNEVDAAMVVTGNPGIGKSRLYLYSIFRLVHIATDETFAEFPPFQLVINCKSVFYIFSLATKEFRLITSTIEQVTLQQQSNVIRLIDGDSSLLSGWEGVSILFSSPGNPGINDFSKVNTTKYVMPVWDYDELITYNGILANDKKLPESILQGQYDKFGGIPRFIYEDPKEQIDVELRKAITFFSPIQVLNYVQSGESIRQDTYSHRILKMVPTGANYLANFYVDFQSKFISEKVVAALESKSVNEITAFYLAHYFDQNSNCAALLGDIYEMLCHRNFAVGQPLELKLRSLSSDEFIQINITADLDIIRFKNLSDIVLEGRRSVTYYRPISEIFGALDAFIVDPFYKVCYGLQMTLNTKHGIKTSPMIDFLKWLGKDYKFVYVFLTPPDREKNFRLQKFLTKNNTVYEKSSFAKAPMQFVCGFDIFLNT